MGNFIVQYWNSCKGQLVVGVGTSLGLLELVLYLLSCAAELTKTTKKV